MNSPKFQASYEATPSPIYRKLDQCRQEIRLFELLPDDDKDAPVGGRLQYHSLADKPVYNTVSYVWGDPSLAEKKIDVDGTSLGVTPNLHRLLRNLRSSQDGGKLLWIDAICINQQDVAERNHQVAMMRQIYEQCCVDLVWLGPTSDTQGGDEGAMESGMQRLGDVCTHDIRGLLGLGKSFTGQDSAEKTWEITKEEISALTHVVVHPEIWNRIWVVQELACATRVILMAGNARLEWDRVAQFLRPLPVSDAFHRQLGSHRPFLEIALSDLLAKLKRIHDQRTLTQTGERQELFDVLARWSESASTDPRDKIYGVLGLAPENLRLPIDYSRTLRDVHLDAARAIIDFSANLDIVAQNPWRQDKEESIPAVEPHREQLLQLPSWVPTFSVRLRAADQRERLLFAQRGIFNAGPATCQAPCHIADDGALRTRGVVLDTVGKDLLGQGSVRSRKRFTLPHLSMLEWVGRDLLDESCPTYVSGEPSFTAYWRTLATDRTGFPMNRLQPDQIRTLDQTLRERMKESTRCKHNTVSDPSVSGAPVLSRTDGNGLLNGSWIMAWRHLFYDTICDAVQRFIYSHWGFNVTARGLYAMLVRGSAQQGDTIACLEGAKVPLVLRQRAMVDPGKGGPLRFEVIGQAYLHGFMDGEAFDSADLRGRLGLETEEIFLV
ncbi:hypothetical protein PG985_001625 [Apiospora marii]|uniref:uncharacterized protein n=1 Tax=Apiospora marii TaxID=335849 RepID=UPI00312E9BA6